MVKDNQKEVKYQYNTTKYRTPDGYTSDIIITTPQANQLAVLLIKRADENAEGHKNIEGGKWAIPGGFVEEGETAHDAAIRELEEETGLTGIPLTAFGTFDLPGRDPRGWMISQAFYAVVGLAEIANYQADDDAAEAKLFPIQEALELPLAFDHHIILKRAYQAISNHFLFTTAIRNFLPKKFTAEELYEALFAIVCSENLPDRKTFIQHVADLPFLNAAGDSYYFVKDVEAKSIFY